MDNDEFVNGCRYHMDQLLATTSELRREDAPKADALQALIETLTETGMSAPTTERAVVGLATLAALSIVEMAYRA